MNLRRGSCSRTARQQWINLNTLKHFAFYAKNINNKKIAVYAKLRASHSTSIFQFLQFFKDNITRYVNFNFLIRSTLLWRFSVRWDFIQFAFFGRFTSHSIRAYAVALCVSFTQSTKLPEKHCQLQGSSLLLCSFAHCGCSSFLSLFYLCFSTDLFFYNIQVSLPFFMGCIIFLLN